jgi:D-3-phosphoglycerate dehydrogenase
MRDPVVEALVLDLLDWLAAGARTYQDVMEAWRTSCPKLPVWEEANDRGLITSERMNGRKLILPSAAGLALLEESRQRSMSKTAHTA